MPSTTVHFPDEVLARIDQVAQRRGISRNRFVVQACSASVADDDGEWPDGFFRLDLPPESTTELEAGVREMERSILDNRRDRGAVLL